jgi:NADPH:quinone reductase-like Zn-dependent oxidoreductase
MRAFTLDNFNTPPGLREDFPTPTPADNEVLVRVRTFLGSTAPTVPSRPGC